MRFVLPFVLVPVALSWGYHPTDFESPLETIAFGSCNRDEAPQPLWPLVEAKEPDLWIWGGDNIYADWRGGNERPDEVPLPEWIRRRYAAQFERPDYRRFRENHAILGTWDDHDYGDNDADASFPHKETSAGLLLDFLEVPVDDPRRDRAGVYGGYVFGTGDRKAKVLLVDNRYFADDKASPDPRLLGAEQREWLENELRNSDAALHFIVSGTQVISRDHRWEKWADYPATREWLLDLIVRHQVPGVVFLSGDRHIHELSVLAPEGLPYRLVDLTSSGLTHSWENFPGEPNRHRVGEVVTELGFGLVRIDWDADPIAVEFSIHTQEESPALRHIERYPDPGDSS